MGGVTPDDLDLAPDAPTTDVRAAVRERFGTFAKGFSKTLPHEEKIERYLDVLVEIPIDDLEASLDSLKGAASLPAPDKIKEAAVAARMLRDMRKAAAEGQAALARLADPEVRAQMRAELAAQAGELLADFPQKDVLDRLVEDAAAVGLVGEDRAVKLVFLALHTRHFDVPGRPVSTAIKGTSSAGKSYTVKCGAKFLAPGSVIEMSGMSPKWMAYAAQQGLDFSHRFLFVHEATGIDEEVEGMLRVLLSEGCIIWRTVIDQVAHTLRVEGPTGLIETTTRISLHEENETRMLSIPVNESTEQTQKVLHRIGKGPREVDFGPWHALDRWIAIGPRRVEIPFQQVIGKLARPVAPRVRRDLTTLLELIRAHALLHEPQREVRDGAVIATLDDYRAVTELTHDLFAAAVELTVSPNVRETVTAACQIVAEKYDKDAMEAIATSAEIARRLRKDRRSVNRWIAAAIEGEFLESMLRTRGQGIAERVRPGSRSMPAEGASVFPTADKIEAYLRSNGAVDDDDDQQRHEQQEHDDAGAEDVASYS